MLYLRKYIKLLFESSDLSALENKYSSEIIKKKYPQSHYELHHIIDELKDVSKKYVGKECLNKLKEKILENNYELLGEGNYRSVYSKPEVDFIIKLSRKTIEEIDDDVEKYIEGQKQYNIAFPDSPKKYNETHFDIIRKAKKDTARGNSIEYNKSLEYGNKFFTKQYAVDEKNNYWVISEKVNKLYGKDFGKFFPYLYNLYIKLLVSYIKIFFRIEDITEEKVMTHINSDSFLQSFFLAGKVEFMDSIFSGLENKRIFNFKDILKQFIFITNPFCESSGVELVTAILKEISDIEHLKELNKEIYNIPIRNGNYLSGIVEDIMLEIGNLSSNLSYLLNDMYTDLNMSLNDFPDLTYLMNIVINANFKDFHVDNIGYRNNDMNKEKPWKNLVFLDYGN